MRLTLKQGQTTTLRTACQTLSSEPIFTCLATVPSFSLKFSVLSTFLDQGEIVFHFVLRKSGKHASFLVFAYNINLIVNEKQQQQQQQQQ